MRRKSGNMAAKETGVYANEIPRPTWTPDTSVLGRKKRAAGIRQSTRVRTTLRTLFIFYFKYSAASAGVRESGETDSGR